MVEGHLRLVGLPLLFEANEDILHILPPPLRAFAFRYELVKEVVELIRLILLTQLVLVVELLLKFLNSNDFTPCKSAVDIVDAEPFHLIQLVVDDIVEHSIDLDALLYPFLGGVPLLGLNRVARV